MEPKFQSSFIPKGPVSSAGSGVSIAQHKSSGLISLLAVVIFTATVILCVGVFGYNFYLNHRITQIGVDLDAARAQVDTSAVTELLRSDARINSTVTLLDQHVITSPIFAFLEEKTLKSVRFVEFNYETADNGTAIRLRGNARGYSAVALQTEAFVESPYFSNINVTDLSLDDDGNVVFTLNAYIDPSLLSYKRVVEQEAVEAPLEAVQPAATTTATTTLQQLDARATSSSPSAI